MRMALNQYVGNVLAIGWRGNFINPPHFPLPVPASQELLGSTPSEDVMRQLAGDLRFGLVGPVGAGQPRVRPLQSVR